MTTVLLLPWLMQGCGNGDDGAAAALLAGSGGRDEARPSHYQASIEDARGFAVEYGDGYKILQVFSHWHGDDASSYHREYLLAPEGVTPPAEHAHLPLIRTPIRSIVTTSPTQSILLDPLGAEGIIVGHSSREVWDPDVDQGIATGRIAVVGRTANINIERVLALAPDVFMAGASLTEGQAAYSIFEDSGIAVIPNAEYMEASVLGRAEWVKLMGILLDEEERAEAFHDEVKASYRALKALAENLPDKPLVLADSPNRGTWYQPSGGSYVAELIVDAGGDYPWSHVEGVGSFSVSFEEMVQLGLRADVWLNPVASITSLTDIRGTDIRLADLRPYALGQVYGFTRRVNAEGANDYWESGVIRPDRILADLIHILHPRLLPDHELFYYRKYE